MSRRPLAALSAAALLLASTAAQAHCPTAAEQSAFEVGALKSEMSVLAVGCGDETADAYNRFIERDRGELVREDGVVNAWFKRVYGRSAQARYDQYITLLANEQGIRGQHEGMDFCARLKPIFSEAMVVPVPQLPEYVAAKDLFPKDMACDTAELSGPATTVAARGKGPARHTAAKKKS